MYCLKISQDARDLLTKSFNESIIWILYIFIYQVITRGRCTYKNIHQFLPYFAKEKADGTSHSWGRKATGRKLMGLIHDNNSTCELQENLFSDSAHVSTPSFLQS